MSPRRPAASASGGLTTACWPAASASGGLPTACWPAARVWLIVIAWGCGALGGSPRAAVAVEVDPGRLEVTGAAGGTLTGTLTVTNHRRDPVTVQAAPGPYRYMMTAHTRPSDPAAQPLPSCEPWLTVTPAALPLAPQSAGALTYTITIPAEAGRDGRWEYLAALVVDEGPSNEAAPPAEATPEASGTVTIRPRVAVPVYVVIAGHPAPQGTLTAFSVAPGPSPDLVQLLLTVANEGPIHLRPTGTVVVTDAQGATVYQKGLGRTVPIFPQHQEGIPVWVPVGPGRHTAVATVSCGTDTLAQRALTFTVTGDGQVAADPEAAG